MKHSPRPHSSVSSASAQSSPFAGRGIWIWYVSRSNGGNLASIIATARGDGISTLIIKAGDGTWSWSQFNPQTVAILHASGFKVCAWQYVYGVHPSAEAQVAAAAARDGADCLLIDAESEYEGRYVQAQEYVRSLRQLIAASFPVGLAGFPYVDYHPGFPYSVFLGAGGAQYNVPQMYWPDIGTTPDAVYAHTFQYNAVYQRPIDVIGELTGDPPADQVLRFRALSRAYGAALVSWWDWQGASAQGWQAIAGPLPSLGGLTPQVGFPLLSDGSGGGISAGDLVVWAQEHLVEAGAALQVDGKFGSTMRSAVQQFQSLHGLPATGMVDGPTWQALLSYPRPHVTWTKQPGGSSADTPGTGVLPRRAARDVSGRAPAGLPASPTGGAGMKLPTPWSARLPAQRYEIPRDLGAGRRGR